VKEPGTVGTSRDSLGAKDGAPVPGEEFPAKIRHGLAENTSAQLGTGGGYWAHPHRDRRRCARHWSSGATLFVDTDHS